MEIFNYTENYNYTMLNKTTLLGFIEIPDGLSDGSLNNMYTRALSLIGGFAFTGTFHIDCNAIGTFYVDGNTLFGFHAGDVFLDQTKKDCSNQ